MFEKSLYDLIRGLRHHKGNEREYIQNSLRECRLEIRGQDMDVKTTALLKLMYLEMFGHDMSWASFHVLEVMSSAKYVQKRVGYLGAVQSFRPDTEVLMLATNLLKKDIGTSSIPTICSPLITIPHIVTPSLALSLLPDLTPRLSHSNPTVRKKALVTLYRLALVYPEALRSAWPKIKDIIMDDEEDSSVVAAAINVVCELGWRRPRDFLPLAPRFFDLLVEGGNNWMAIKIIKLFATLTPLEPRLIKKLLPPLIRLIQTTPAMSLLYECIHGIIQGGILESQESIDERDEIAELCVSKLQGMIAMEGDPNLKYVALLSFNKIVETHAQLVASYQDVILDCIDDPDISIRLQALELGSGMVNSDNLGSVITRLLQQLRDAPVLESSTTTNLVESHVMEPEADFDGEDPTETLHEKHSSSMEPNFLPEEYRNAVVTRILDMCSRDTYSNITDFEWYLDILLELVSLVPVSSAPNSLSSVSGYIGSEIRNIAVRVAAVRPHAVRIAAQLLSPDKAGRNRTAFGSGVLSYAVWIVGEYSGYLLEPGQVLESVLHLPWDSHEAEALCACLHSVPKLLGRMFSASLSTWGPQQKAMTSLLLARVLHFLEPFTSNGHLEVQERAVEFLELFRVASEAVAAYDVNNEKAPLLLSDVLPSLFTGSELGPVASTAQRKVPTLDGLDLSASINDRLSTILQSADNAPKEDYEAAEFRRLYLERPKTMQSLAPALASNSAILQPHQTSIDMPVYTQEPASQRLGRRKMVQDDPFYIPAEDNPGSQSITPFDEILRSNNGQEVDIDSIPIMNLELGPNTSSQHQPLVGKGPQKREKAHVAQEETLDITEPLGDPGSDYTSKRAARKGLLQVDSSGIGTLPLNVPNHSLSQDEDTSQPHSKDDVAMAAALAEVERLRMEMQRASERVQPADITDDGALVKKKRSKKKAKVDGSSRTKVEPYSDAPDKVKPKKKKTKKSKETTE